MNTLVAVAIAPVGVGEELSKHVAEVVKVIRESGLPNKTYSMFTEIEGDWDSVMAVVKRATFVLAEKGIRTEVVLKADIRPNFSNMMDGKIDRLNEALEEQPQAEVKPPVEEKPQSVEDKIRATLGRIGGRR
ncbi:MAG: MTH1187 family thiamine-binding protein [Selenomonadaceae bacterium]|nr:MTH1187 family thiamine-binding protein [Selenomonadaceae bacterium]